MFWFVFFFFKQKTAYDMRISDWSSDVCSSDLHKVRSGCRWGCGTASRRAASNIGSRSARADRRARRAPSPRPDRKSVVEGKSVSVRVDLGGRRIIKKKNKALHNINYRSSRYVSTVV